MEEEFMIHIADGRAYKYIPKGEQLLITNEPSSQVDKDEQCMKKLGRDILLKI